MAMGLSGFPVAWADLNDGLIMEWNGSGTRTQVGASGSVTITKIPKSNGITKVILEGELSIYSPTYGYVRHELPSGFMPISAQPDAYTCSTQIHETKGDTSNIGNYGGHGVHVRKPDLGYENAVLWFPEKFYNGKFSLKCEWETDSPDAHLVHKWTFNDGTANDSVGTSHGTLFKGATISNGQLVLDGIDDYVRTSVIDNTITTKTLMVWATLNNLDQRSGGLLTIEQAPTQVFDSIVYAERTPKQWMAGSSWFQRSPVNNGGAPETELRELFIAIVYKTDNSIEIYRNGQRYGSSYTQGTLQTYSGGTDLVLFGVRHNAYAGYSGTTTGNDAFFAGTINEARIYNTALSASEIQARFNTGPCLSP
jgi:hypothetical protein